MIYLDANKRVIDQRVKDSHSVEINGHGKFVGHRFLLKTRLFGDKRCIYCGRWFHWQERDILTGMRNYNIKRTKDRSVEPLHCNSEHCQEFHRRFLLSIERRKREMVEKKEKLTFTLFKQLKSQMLVN